VDQMEHDLNGSVLYYVHTIVLSLS